MVLRICEENRQAADALDLDRRCGSARADPGARPPPRDPPGERVWLFGSRARGDHFERSDIDLAIEAPEIDRGEWAMLHLDLEEEAATLLLIDFVLMDDLPESFRRRVHREGRLLYERGNPARLP